MIDLTTASAALKNLYLGVLTEQLNTKINPLLSRIEQTSYDVYGKEVKKIVTDGINGGIGSGTETGALPVAAGNNYVELTVALKNFFGRIEISDKAILASQDSSGAVVNLLNAEMESLVKASRFNFGRMLFGNGSGKLAVVEEYAGNADTKKVKLDTVANLCAGMIVDIAVNGSVTSSSKGKKVVSVDYANKVITLNSGPSTAFAAGSVVYVQNSKNNELTGIGAIFDVENTPSLYGLTRADHAFLSPIVKSAVGELEIADIQDAVDEVEMKSGASINYITSSYAVRKKYVALCTAHNANVDVMNLDGGYKALSFSGIPFVADRFCPEQSMYLLNTDNFRLHQLCDWRWLEGENGNVLKQSANSAVYTATLVKYADLLCDRPVGQAMLSGITAA